MISACQIFMKHICTNVLAAPCICFNIGNMFCIFSLNVFFKMPPKVVCVCANGGQELMS